MKLYISLTLMKGMFYRGLMDVYQQIYEVVYGHYRPWLMHEVSTAKFKEMCYELDEPRPVNELVYRLDYFPPISYKRKFYLQLIDQDVVHALNTLHFEINASSTNQQKRYHVYEFIHQFIHAYCISTKQFIEERELTVKSFVAQDGIVPQGNKIDEAYVFHYLKHQLIRNYLEVCVQYPEYIKEVNTGLAEAYMHYFNELPAEPPVLFKPG